MIIKVNSESQLNICIDIIHKSFNTVADNMNLTPENCPGHTAFMPIQRLQSQFKHGVKMFLYKYNNVFVGYFSLSVEKNEVELNNLSVLPEYRHRGIGKELINYAMNYSKRTLGASKIKIGIIEENIILKEWYKNFGFTHTAAKKFVHFFFTVLFMELEI